MVKFDNSIALLVLILIAFIAYLTRCTCTDRFIVSSGGGGRPPKAETSAEQRFIDETQQAEAQQAEAQQAESGAGAVFAGRFAQLWDQLNVVEADLEQKLGAVEREVGDVRDHLQKQISTLEAAIPRHRHAADGAATLPLRPRRHHATVIDPIR